MSAKVRLTVFGMFFYFLATPPAFSIGGSGIQMGGGGSVVCRSRVSDRELPLGSKVAFLLDLYVARDPSEWQWTDLHPNHWGRDRWIEQMRESLKHLDEDRQLALSQGFLLANPSRGLCLRDREVVFSELLYNFEQVVSHSSRRNISSGNISFSVGDEGSPEIRHLPNYDCEYRSVIKMFELSCQPGLIHHLEIDIDYYNLLSPLHQASLELHEAVSMYVRSVQYLKFFSRTHESSCQNSAFSQSQVAENARYIREITQAVVARAIEMSPVQNSR